MITGSWTRSFVADFCQIFRKNYSHRATACRLQSRRNQSSHKKNACKGCVRPKHACADQNLFMLDGCSTQRPCFKASSSPSENVLSTARCSSRFSYLAASIRVRPMAQGGQPQGGQGLLPSWADGGWLAQLLVSWGGRPLRIRRSNSLWIWSRFTVRQVFCLQSSRSCWRLSRIIPSWAMRPSRSRH